MQRDVAGRQASDFAAEAAQAEVHRRDGRRRNSRRQAQQVAEAIDAHAVERKEVAAEVAAAGEDGRKALCARGYARTRHCELQRVVLSDGAQDLTAQGFHIGGEGAGELFAQAAKIGLDCCRQSVL